MTQTWANGRQVRDVQFGFWFFKHPNNLSNERDHNLVQNDVLEYQI
jgi:hypothetical protein